MVKEAKIWVDDAKLKEMGDGSVSGFARKYGLERFWLYHIRNKTHVRPGTKSERTFKMLHQLGVAGFKVEEEDKT
jgi:hypothetical protein